MIRKKPQIKLAEPATIIDRIDTLALINRHSKAVPWRKIVRRVSANTEVDECVRGLAMVWFGEDWNSYNLPLLSTQLYELFCEVGIMRDIAFMRCVILPYAEDEFGQEVDTYQLLAQVLMP